MTTLRAGTRASSLARIQTDYVSGLLTRAGHGIETVLISTKGDEARDARFRDLGSGIFTRALDEALLDGRIDFAVHSAKDVPTDFPDAIGIAAYLQRKSPQDAIVLFKGGTDYRNLAKGSVIGTSSARRKALLLNSKPDLVISELRGNVKTRLEKARDAGFDGAVLAKAGLERLGLTPPGHLQILPPHEFVPAPGQGALAVACLKSHAIFPALKAALDHMETRQAVMAERAFLARLGGGCQIPAGAYADILQGVLHLRAVLLSPTGSACVRITRQGAPGDARRIGEAAVSDLLAQGGHDIQRAFLDSNES